MGEIAGTGTDTLAMGQLNAWENRKALIYYMFLFLKTSQVVNPAATDKESGIII